MTTRVREVSALEQLAGYLFAGSWMSVGGDRTCSATWLAA